jgi:hypothetical protein
VGIRIRISEVCIIFTECECRTPNPGATYT